MSHISFAPTRFQIRIAVLAGPALLAFAAPAAYGQGRSMQSRFVTMTRCAGRARAGKSDRGAAGESPSGIRRTGL
jgi:hypothetical protein